MTDRFTHIDDKGQVRMVDVTAKTATEPIARAQAEVSMQPDTLLYLASINF